MCKKLIQNLGKRQARFFNLLAMSEKTVDLATVMLNSF